MQGIPWGLSNPDPKALKCLIWPVLWLLTEFSSLYPFPLTQRIAF